MVCFVLHSPLLIIINRFYFEWCDFKWTWMSLAKIKSRPSSIPATYLYMFVRWIKKYWMGLEGWQDHFILNHKNGMSINQITMNNYENLKAHVWKLKQLLAFLTYNHTVVRFLALAAGSVCSLLLLYFVIHILQSFSVLLH